MQALEWLHLLLFFMVAKEASQNVDRTEFRLLLLVQAYYGLDGMDLMPVASYKSMQ